MTSVFFVWPCVSCWQCSIQVSGGIFLRVFGSTHKLYAIHVHRLPRVLMNSKTQALLIHRIFDHDRSAPLTISIVRSHNASRTRALGHQRKPQVQSQVATSLSGRAILLGRLSKPKPSKWWLLRKIIRHIPCSGSNPASFLIPKHEDLGLFLVLRHLLVRQQ